MEEPAIPIREDVAGACELLGLDPLFVACEGRCVAFVAPEDAGRALAVMARHPLGWDARRIGVVLPREQAPVVMVSRIGTRRIVDMPSGEQLPRIC